MPSTTLGKKRKVPIDATWLRLRGAESAGSRAAWVSWFKLWVWCWRSRRLRPFELANHDVIWVTGIGLWFGFHRDDYCHRDGHRDRDSRESGEKDIPSQPNNLNFQDNIMPSHDTAVFVINPELGSRFQFIHWPRPGAVRTAGGPWQNSNDSDLSDSKSFFSHNFQMPGIRVRVHRRCKSQFESRRSYCEKIATCPGQPFRLVDPLDRAF